MEDMSIEEAHSFPWVLDITPHAVERAKQKFRLRDEEVEAFIQRQLLASTSTRRVRDGALRWTSEDCQLVTRWEGEVLRVITCYPKDRERDFPKRKKVTWRSPYKKEKHT